jgi:hypothetical protein
VLKHVYTSITIVIRNYAFSPRSEIYEFNIILKINTVIFFLNIPERLLFLTDTARAHCKKEN